MGSHFLVIFLKKISYGEKKLKFEIQIFVAIKVNPFLWSHIFYYSSLDMGPNHFFRTRVESSFKNLKLDRVEFLDSNFEPNRTDGDRTELQAFFEFCPLFGYIHSI